MSALTKFFFRAPYSLPRTPAIFRWWESRRQRNISNNKSRRGFRGVSGCTRSDSAYSVNSASSASVFVPSELLEVGGRAFSPTPILPSPNLYPHLTIVLPTRIGLNHLSTPTTMYSIPTGLTPAGSVLSS